MDDPTRGDTDLEQRLRALEAERDALRESEARLRLLSDATTETIAVLERAHVVDCNPRVETMFGYTIEQAIGLDALLFIVPEQRSIVADHIRTGYDRPYEVDCQRRDGSAFPAQVLGRPVVYRGRPARVTMVLDITERKRLEYAAAAAAAHDALLAALTTPVLPIAEGVVLMPIIGQLMAERADQTLDAVLRGISEHRARAVILDVTGLRTVDAVAADTLLRAARATRLLGAQAILTGVGPEVAQVLVGLGHELGAVEIRGTLRDGVRAALDRA